MSKGKLLRLLPVALSALSFVIPVTAQVFLPPGATDTGLGGGNAISGTILVSNGQRLERHVSIRLQTMTKGDRVAASDDNGNFAFKGLPNGTYTLLIDKEKEFEPYRQTVDIRQFQGAPPQVYPLNIRLQLKGGAEAKTGILNAALADVPPRALAFYQKALEQAQAGKNKDAIEQLNQAIAEYPGFMLAFNELAFNIFKAVKWKRPMNRWRRLLRSRPRLSNP